MPAAHPASVRACRTAGLLACALLVIGSCEHDDPRSVEAAPADPREVSRRLAAEFPLLPVIEGTLWRQLEEAEDLASNPGSTESQREEATAGIHRITDRLQEKHPFRQEEQRTMLGGIVHHKESGKIEIPVAVCFPKESDSRHPGELELILCATTGRSHETLFTTDARPLHLELLMHLAGYRKSPPSSTFRVDVVIPDHDPIPIESLIRSADGDPLPERLLWEFSGGEFTDPYLPDMTGDFLICWHAHESVLRIRHEGIASGEIKLKPVAHPALKQNQPATLILSPE